MKKKSIRDTPVIVIPNLIIGIVIIFVIAMGAPLLINGLSAWVG